MPGTTARGLPYPLPTEPVAEGAAAIRALAEAVDALDILSSRRIFKAPGPSAQQATAATYSFWPSTANFPVAIPSWATYALCVWNLNYFKASGSSGALFVKPQIGSSLTGWEWLIHAVGIAGNASAAVHDEIGPLGALAGTTQNFAMTAKHAGLAYLFDLESHVSLDVQFIKR